MPQIREQWLARMLQIADPVLNALEARRLRKALPVPFHAGRAAFAPLEAFGRTACGIAPWLELDGLTGAEAATQAAYRARMLACLDAATDPASPDRMIFDGDHSGAQPLVDAAFLAHALVRAPRALAAALDGRVRENLCHALRQTRAIRPPQNNWFFFSAMVEAGLRVLGDTDARPAVAAHALDAFEGWYKGDGIYGDGARYHWDYYNSFVIQPMQLDLTRVFADDPACARHRDAVLAHATRYAQVLERMIAPDGTYPVVGRSVAYRFGAFQLLAQAALQGILPEGVQPAQVRAALSAVMERTMAAPSMFDADGWLRPGVYGFQPGLAEGYINTGSLYLCMAVFLPLGLTPADAFWAEADRPWTAVRIWAGEDMPADHALAD